MVCNHGPERDAPARNRLSTFELEIENLVILTRRISSGFLPIPGASSRRMASRVFRCAAVGITLLSGCAGPQSALDPAGAGAELLANLFWVMAGTSLVIWLIVVGLGIYFYLHPETGSRRKAAITIIGGGVVFPTIVLTVLLAFGLSILPQVIAPAPEGSLTIEVTGYQWWWKVRYLTDEPVELANEIHLPVGEPIQFILHTADVIHSFWIPSLGGKVDMIPGRQTRLTLHPTRTGTFRGACAELCGTSHALMCFDVVVEDKESFERWLAEQATPAQETLTPTAEQGRDRFLANGCGGCHRIGGTPARGSIGPDLSHVGSRKSLAAATLLNNSKNLQAWIARPDSIKPDVLMPHFHMLPPDEIAAIAAYLEELK